jgi:2-amino-4-hydroxy-6-hydroxymethyldihydropteridine diphosphokinase
LGDRRAHLAFAVERLRSRLTHLRQSSWLDTEPVGVGDQPRFLNGAVVGETTLPPRALLDELLQIERVRGRVRPFAGAPRTLDLDLVLYDEVQLEESGLVVPHPRFRERLFVLEPLAELAPDWIDPVTGESISALLQRARQRHA